MVRQGTLVRPRKTRKAATEAALPDFPITSADALARLQEKARNPTLDQRRTAKNIAPADADTPEEVAQQRRWYRNPRRMDFQGVDAPQGVGPTPPPQKKTTLTTPQDTPPELTAEETSSLELPVSPETVPLPAAYTTEKPTDTVKAGLSFLYGPQRKVARGRWVVYTYNPGFGDNVVNEFSAKLVKQRGQDIKDQVLASDRPLMVQDHEGNEILANDAWRTRKAGQVSAVPTERGYVGSYVAMDGTTYYTTEAFDRSDGSFEAARRIRDYVEPPSALEPDVEPLTAYQSLTQETVEEEPEELASDEAPELASAEVPETSQLPPEPESEELMDLSPAAQPPIMADSPQEEDYGYPEQDTADRGVYPAQRRATEGVGREYAEEQESEAVQFLEDFGPTGEGTDFDGGSDQEAGFGVYPEPSDVPEPGLAVGDSGEDFGSGTGLELHQLEPAPLAPNKDWVLSPENLSDSFIVSAPQRFDANLEAIRLLKQLEQENRLATPQEQAILARYSGFGDSAFSPAFNTYARDDVWKRRGDALRELVTDDEYRAIEKSRLNAFYTTPEVIDATWQVLERLGADQLQRPRVLEPSAGSGRFLGLQPVDLAARSQRTAVELDHLTGGMLKHLYPNAEVYAGMGYQDVPIPNDSIDMAISNVPFGNYPVTDPEFGKGRKLLTRQIHNYFFAKTLDKLRPGGMLAFVTSHNTLDAPSAQPVREALAQQADLVAAIRLPKDAFPDTEVVTDLIFMRKRLPGEVAGDTSWVESNPMDFEVRDPNYSGRTYSIEHHVNQYFQDHPEMVLGEHSATGSMYRRNEYSVESREGEELSEALRAAVERVPSDRVITPPAEVLKYRRANPDAMNAINVKVGAYTIGQNGELLVKKSPHEVVPAGVSKDNEARIRGMLGLRDAGREVLNRQLQDRPDAEVQEAQQELNQRYDAFVSQHGPLNAKANADLMRLDPDGAFLRALEQQPDPKSKKWEKMPLFDRRVVRGLSEHSATSPSDALAITLNETGGLDFDRMGDLLGVSGDEVKAELARDRVIFKNPVGGWETADQYLTGDVRAKLRTAESAASANPLYQANVEALAEVQPEDLPPSQIDVQLGSPWVPSKDVNDFVAQLVGAYTWRGRNNYFSYVSQTGEWVGNDKVDGNRAKMVSEWGTQRMSAPEIIHRLLNSKPVEVFDTDDNDKKVRNATETVAVQQKANAIQEEFKKWIWEDPDRAQRLARYYNGTFNNLRPRAFDGSHLTFPGMKTQWADQLHSHQKDAVWRVLQDGTTLLAHEVGFGKTAVMVGAGMELRRLGLARKNLYVVPKATHPQFRGQFLDIYPYAKVLFPEQDDFSPQKRPELMSRIATGDWDAVIVSDTQFRRLPVRPETEAAFIREEMDDLRAALIAEEQEGGGARSKTHKELQKALTRLEERLKAAALKSREVSDDTIYFEDLGIDQMFVDEADMFKNLRFTTKMSRIKGLPNTDSQRAWDMYMKVRYLQKKGSGRGVVFATGTPIANTVAEGYTMMRYLQPNMLEERGLQHFDAWARTFGGTTEALEQTPTGAYRLTQRFAKFNNVPELSHLWQATADIRVASEVPELVKLQPRLVNEQGEEGKRTVVTAPPSQDLKDFMQELARRADNLSNVGPSEDNMLKIANDARMASLDMRLVEPRAKDDPDGKLALATQKIAANHRQTQADQGTQLVFLDLGTPKAQDKVSEENPLEEGDTNTASEQALLKNVYGDLRNKLVKSGVPAKEIAFIHDAKNNKQKDALFDKVNSGEVRVLIGSTGKMGAGVNVQKRAAALHHLDAPWRPRDIEQREGRIVRQGNEVYGPKLAGDGNVLDPGPGVRIYNYVTEGSFDGYMWQAIEAKAKAIRSLMRRNVTVRSIEDVDSLTLSAGEAKALASGNPDVMRAVQLKNDIGRLQLVRSSHRDSTMRARTELEMLPRRIANTQGTLEALQADQGIAESNNEFSLSIGNRTITDRPEAGKMVAEMLPNLGDGEKDHIGYFRGLALEIRDTPNGYRLTLQSPQTGLEYHSSAIAPKDVSSAGVAQRLDNLANSLSVRVQQAQQDLEQAQASLKTYQEMANKPFAEGDRLQKLQDELKEVERRLQGVKDEGNAPEMLEPQTFAGTTQEWRRERREDLGDFYRRPAPALAY